MTDSSEESRDTNPRLDRIEVALWIGLLVFGSWIAFEWLTAEPPAVVAATATPERESPPASLFPRDLIEAEALGVRETSRAFDYSLRPIEADPTQAGTGWSRDGYMQARGASEGDFIDFGLPRRYPGDYRIVVYLTRAPEHGVVAFRVNGERIGDEIDLSSDARTTPTGPISLDVVSLQGRGDRLRIEVVRAGERGPGGFDFALDGIRLEKIALRD